MAGAKIIVEGVLADFPTYLTPKIDGEPTREVLVNLHQLVSGNAASMASKLGEG